MEFRHLRTFQVVAKTLSFSRAAEELRLAQSAVSRQIIALEAELGFKLFVRTTSHVRLTDAGRHLHSEVDRLLAHLAIAITGAQQIARGHSGELNLGLDWRILMPHVPEAVVAFRRTHPHVTVNFVELRMHAQIEALQDGRIHLGFVHKAIIGSHTELDLQQVYSTKMKLAVAADHPRARSRRVAIRDLRDETWVKLDEKTNPGFRAFVVQLCHPALFTPKFGRAAQSLEGLLALVAVGDGVCLIPAAFVPKTTTDLRYLDTDCPPFELYAIWRKDSPPPGLPDFLTILKQTFAAHLTKGNAAS
ncbi:MAG: LysR substrate-binding domain-containing protein [Verrucomicrobia bacterium]|nr:LysR substrate-binding domain-containing protein [Verrucomicrobiota bacterium]